MRILRDLRELPLPDGTPRPSVVTIGNFDGVHRGHTQVVREVVRRARERDAHAVAITFDPHPAAVLRPDVTPRLITPLDVRLERLAALGLDVTLVLPFTTEMSRWSSGYFATHVLRDALRTLEVHEGENFRFGADAAAGIDGLRALGVELGFSVQTYPPVERRGGAVSSSRIRSLVAAGDISAARALLGRPFALYSTPAAGRGYGTRYAVPTVNLAPTRGLVPGNGVYVTRLRVGTGATAVHFNGVTNAGNRPTFGADSYAIETHLFDFQPIDLTPETPLELTFLHRLRDEQRFDSPELLKQQIGRDVARAQRFLRLACRNT